MREGVIRDIQRQEMRKTQNIKMLQDQAEITKALKGQQEREQEQRQDHSVLVYWLWIYMYACVYVFMGSSIKGVRSRELGMPNADVYF